VTDILQAIKNIVDHPIPDLIDHYKGNNRINNVGDALEHFVRDAFANTLYESDESEKVKKQSSSFAYIGNQNNPPDLILKQGDAVEVKKLESQKSQIALNSSYPKSKLFYSDPMLTKECRECENKEKWSEKDIIYAIGVAKSKKLKLLWFIYGDCIAASRSVYERVKQAISHGIIQIPNIEFSETKELGRVNKVDPLGITYLRIRGMWGIDNPINIYNYLPINYDETKDFGMIAIMRDTKYNSLSEDSRKEIDNMLSDEFKIRNIHIKCPDNPASMISAKLINYRFTNS
jgi:hypothetical protein